MRQPTISMNITALRQHLTETFEGLEASDRPLLITRRGEPLAVVLPAALWNRLEGERELLRRLALGELESAAGHGHELGEVMADCDLLLDEN